MARQTMCSYMQCFAMNDTFLAKMYNSVSIQCTQVAFDATDGFTERRSGRRLKHQRGYWAFLPNPLPPPLELT